MAKKKQEVKLKEPVRIRWKIQCKLVLIYRIKRLIMQKY